MPTLLNKYNSYIAAKGYQHDTRQVETIKVLQRLMTQLTRNKILSLFSRSNDINGAYIFGGVGRGKSMVMDLFFEAVPARIKKRRIHFHEFMIETHDWLHAHRGDDMSDLLMRYADDVRGQIELLCFDEFHVSDITDAMILGRLFEAFFKKNIMIVVTSNVKPDHLYEGGLQRELFLPFIKNLKNNFEVVELNGERDYRALSNPDQDVYYFHPRDDDTRAKIDQLFSELTKGQRPAVKKVTVKKRDLKILSVDGVARFTYEELFEKPLGAEDYIKIANEFDTVFIDNIPVLTAETRNETKRFIIFIDCIYEARARLILSAEADIHDLYQGPDHAFEFDRTISRLMEMQSFDYHEKRSERKQ